MKPDMAVVALRDVLSRLPLGPTRETAFEAFDLLVHAATADEDVVRQAHSDLVAALPERKAAVDRIFSEWSFPSSPPQGT